MHTRRSFVNVQSLSCCIDYSRRSHNIVSVVVVGAVAWHADVSPAGDCRARPRLGPARPASFRVPSPNRELYRCIKRRFEIMRHLTFLALRERPPTPSSQHLWTLLLLLLGERPTWPRHQYPAGLCTCLTVSGALADALRRLWAVMRWLLSRRAATVISSSHLVQFGFTDRPCVAHKPITSQRNRLKCRRCRLGPEDLYTTCSVHSPFQ